MLKRAICEKIHSNISQKALFEQEIQWYNAMSDITMLELDGIPTLKPSLAYKYTLVKQVVFVNSFIKSHTRLWIYIACTT